MKTLAERPDSGELLDLYALYQQATEGDNDTTAPDMPDMNEHYQWKQWNSKRGMTADDAMREYVLLVDMLLKKYAHS